MISIRRYLKCKEKPLYTTIITIDLGLLSVLLHRDGINEVGQQNSNPELGSKAKILFIEFTVQSGTPNHKSYLSI